MQIHAQSEWPEGVVLIDPAFFEKMDENILRAMDIFIDKDGESELVYDFPEEDWKTVYERETKPFISFVENGGLWIKLLSEKDMVFTIEQSKTITSNEYINVISGKIIVVLARELLQCLFYPELEMEIFGSIDLTNGKYSIGYSVNGTITYRKVE
jgi:hypothetical protein